MITRTRSATVENVFVGDAEYTLCIRIGELISLQEKLNSGPYAIAMRLVNGDWRVEDVTETIRLALIGGGLSPKQSYDLVKNYVKEGYLFQYATTAGEAILAATMGVEDEKLDGEGSVADPQPAPSMDLFDGATFTPSEEQQATGQQT